MTLADSLSKLSKTQIFSGLAREELQRVASLSQQRRYDRGDIILSEGEKTRELFIVADGMVQISLRTADASTPLANLGAGQVFGEMALVDRGARSATVEAVKDGTQVYVIAHDDLLQMCEADSRVGFLLMRNLAAELSLRLRYRNIITGQTSTQE
jgi:CRP/FNR family cyclic AMP-dependent transcriptional regulator